MERKELPLTIQNLLFMNLVNKAPTLSGNMKMNIRCGISKPSETQIVIEAPFYDLNKFKQKGIIIHTNENKNGKTDYAYYVNVAGGFATNNASKNWVNRAIYEVITEIANEMNAEVINKLPL